MVCYDVFWGLLCCAVEVGEMILSSGLRMREGK